MGTDGGTAPPPSSQTAPRTPLTFPPAQQSQEPPASSPSATWASPTPPALPLTSSPLPGAPPAPMRMEPIFLELSLCALQVALVQRLQPQQPPPHPQLQQHLHPPPPQCPLQPQQPQPPLPSHHNSRSRLETHLQHSVGPFSRKALRVPLHLAGEDLQLLHQGGGRPGQALVLHHGGPGGQPCHRPGAIRILLFIM